MPVPRAFILKTSPDRGTVYECLALDDGQAAEDTRNTGIPHVSVTLDPTGGYPSFPCPLQDLQLIPT